MTSQGPPERLVEDLATPDAYPDDASAGAGVETLQTHLSHLYLTERRVVKLRKAVRLPFVDFSTREARTRDCHHEVALNRRLAPDVYLGVARVEERSGRFVVREQWESEPPGERLADEECVVVMRRLESGRDALSLLERGELEAEHLDRVATTLARFHERTALGRPAPWDEAGWRRHCLAPFVATLDGLASASLDPDATRCMQELSANLHECFGLLHRRIEARRLEGRAVDGHGDVHLQHIWFERGATNPVLIDCVEFDPALRRIDAASEVAFLAMDLGYRSREDLAAHFLRRYAAATDDFGLYGVVDFHQSYRAAVRAKVAALASVDRRIGCAQREAARASTARHLAVAAERIQPPPPGALAIVSGSVGVGKSTVADALARRTGGVVISSDRVRKQRAGVAPTERRSAAPDRGFYDPARKDAVYAALLERAEPVVASGRIAILDATFDRRERRRRARDWAAERGIGAVLVSVECPEGLARERVTRRAQQGSDASDAGPELVAHSRARFEEAAEWPAADRFVVRTDDAPVLDAVGERLQGARR